ncbi:hypothetical protein V1502_10755 [Bacillus sp. SCS-153A]|uniref:hypothetical protein n=1 Tax=Rossellomorea sedimentorum TaxID=3115294 RepID=UPI0039063870
MGRKIVLPLMIVLVFLTFVYSAANRPDSIEEAIKEAGIEVTEVLYHQAINNNKDSVVIYKLKDIDGVKIGLVNGESNMGWKWESNLGDIGRVGDLDNGFSSNYISLPDKNYSILFGSIRNQDIETVTVGYSFSPAKYVELVNVDDKMTVWFTKWNIDDRKIIVKATGDDSFINEEL